MEASQAALLDEAMKKSGLVWITVPGHRPAPAWYVWRGGVDPAAYVLTEGGEQPVPGLTALGLAASHLPTLRSTASHPTDPDPTDPDPTGSAAAGVDPGDPDPAGRGLAGPDSAGPDPAGRGLAGPGRAGAGAGGDSEDGGGGVGDGEVTVAARSKDTGALLIAWTARVAVVPPDSPEWAEVLPDLQAKRLNPPDGLDAPTRWARDAHLVRLTPTGHITAGPAAGPAPS